MKPIYIVGIAAIVGAGYLFWKRQEKREIQLRDTLLKNSPQFNGQKTVDVNLRGVA